MANDKTILLKVQLDTGQLKANAKAAEAALQKLTPELKKIAEEQGKTSIAYVKAKTEIQRQNKILKDNVSALEKTERANKANTGSMQEMKDQLSAATLQYNNMTKSQRKNSEEGIALKKHIKGLSDELKGNEEEIGNNTRSVGNYGKAMSALPGSLGAAAGGVKNLITQFKVFLANPIVLTIVGIVGALKALKKSFTSTEEGQNKMAKATAVVSYLFDKLLDFIEPIASFLADVVVGAFESVGDAIEATSEAIADALEWLGFGDAAEGIREYNQAASDALKKVQEIADLRASADKDERKNIVERAKAEASIAELRNKAADKEKYTADERKKYLTEASKLNDEIFAREEAIAQKRFDAIREENKLTNSTKEAKKEEAEAEAKLISVQTSRYNNQKKLTAELTTVERELESDRKAAESEAKSRFEAYKARMKERLAFARQIRDEEIKLIEDKNVKEATSLIESANRRIEDLKDSKATAEEKARLIFLINENLQKDLTELEKKYDKIAQDAMDKEKESIDKNYNDTLNVIQGYFNEVEEIVAEDVKYTEDAEKKKTQIISEENSKRITTALNSANQLSNALFQIKQNQIQEELNADKEKYDEQTKLLDDQLAAGLISQAQYDAQKSALDAKAAAKEKKLKEEAYKSEKTAKLISAGINVALGVTSALTLPPPAGVIMAGVTAALGAIEIAAIASAPTPKFAKGGVFGGKPHSQGGTKGVFDDGTQIEVEKDEHFVILNKNAKGLMSQLDHINQSTGGVPLMARGGVMKFASGGVAVNNASKSGNASFNQSQNFNNALANLPPIFVAVEDINTGVGQYANVINRSDF
jgi:hypothetical protein